jgi:glycosyltransferase involved in cell wall biosynthesis
MINAVGDFCDAAPVPVCERCIDLGGAHAASRMTDLGPASHRAMFAGLLSSAHQVVAPSASAARYLRRAFPDLAVTVIPHPEGAVTFAEAARSGDDHEITLFGAIGPHKGSAKLLEIAQRAKLAHPLLRFRVIGHTDIDERLLGLGNVTITGPYDPQDLAQLGAAATGRLALFLSGWPETYCYTLSEAVQLGFIPLVPDLGALAERVRAAGFGVVFPFPIDAVQVLELIENIAAGKVKLRETHASPSSYKNSPKTCGWAAESRILEANAQFEWTPQAVAG